MTLTQPFMLLRFPRVTAMMTTGAVHVLLLLLATALASQHHDLYWRQVAIDTPVIEAYLYTQVPTAIAPATRQTQERPATKAPAKQPVTKQANSTPAQATPSTTVVATVTQAVPASSATPADKPAETAYNTQTQQQPAAPVSDSQNPALNRKAEPDYAYNPPPEYPMLLRQNNISGGVMMRVFVHADGLPGDIRIQQSSGYRLMDEAALKAVRQWRFVPALDNGQRSASWVEFPINFSLKG